MKTYPKQKIAVGWEPEICVHSGICSAGLPQVFQPKERPWVKVENASEQEIIDQVRRCPSGALSIVKIDEKD